MGHVHDDALALELWCSGKPVFVDPGTYTYTVDAGLRSWYRSAAAHSTGCVDGRPQPAGAEPFQWVNLRGGRLSHQAAGPDHHWLELVRDIRLDITTVSHRRRIVAWHGLGWLIWDRFHGRGAHKVQLRFQFPSEEEPPSPAGGFCKLSSGLVLTLPRRPEEWSLEVIDSRISPLYGCSQPASAWLLTADTHLPTDILTVVFPRASVRSSRVRLVESVLRRPAQTRWHGLCRAVEVRDSQDATCQRIFLQEDPERAVVIGGVTARLTTAWVHHAAGAEHLALLLDSVAGPEIGQRVWEGPQPMSVDGEPVFAPSTAATR